ncbi:MAG: sulfatase, partial [Phycisphaerales bacterium JB038]
GGAANLWSIFPDALATYPELLAEAGYITGRSGKGWGPGRMETKGREPAGDRYKNFETFLAARSIEAPFVYWLGSADPHRPYDKGSGAASGMDLSKVHLFGHFPDATAIRSDVADYYFEVQRFDALVGSALAQLAEIGELDNTIIVMTGDHGMPFPRCKANLYDSGARVPLAVRWGAKVKGERVLDDLVSLVDLAPTFLEAAGVPVPDDMTGRCLSTLLLSDEQGLVEPKRDHVLTGKERHVPCQEAPDRGGYPCRALRTQDYLYIRNSTPERWPAGTPHFEQATIPGVWLGDCDNGPTKTWLVENREKDEAHQRSWDWCFAKRPAEELYDLKKDPEQLHNVAGDPTYAEVQAKLAARLTERLRATEDPRVLQPEEADAFFTNHPYYGRGPRHPSTTGQ